MKDTSIGRDSTIEKSIVAENCRIGERGVLGTGNEAPNKFKEDVYAFGLVTIGDDSVVPNDVKIGKNTAISGVTTKEDYPDGLLASGEVIIKAGDRK
jgi:glucose-1-phosphate adenylyltransferase